MAGIAVKGESRAVGMRAATMKEVCGVAELAVKGESMAVGIRPTTIKKGVRRGGTRGQSAGRLLRTLVLRQPMAWCGHRGCFYGLWNCQCGTSPKQLGKADERPKEELEEMAQVEWTIRVFLE